MKGFLLLTIFRLIRGRILFANLQRWQALPLFLMKFLVHKFSGNRWNCIGNNYSFGCLFGEPWFWEEQTMSLFCMPCQEQSIGSANWSNALGVPPLLVKAAATGALRIQVLEMGWSTSWNWVFDCCFPNSHKKKTQDWVAFSIIHDFLYTVYLERFCWKQPVRCSIVV